MNRLGVLVLTAASVLSSGPLAAAVCSKPDGRPETCSYNGITFSMDQVMRFAPEVQFHFGEKFFPVSIEELLLNSNSSLVREAQGKIVEDLGKPTADMMATYYTWNDSTKTGYRLLLPNTPWNWFEYGADIDEAARRVIAPMYVSVQAPPDRSYLELNFIMLYAHNAGQVMRALRAGDHFNFSLDSLGQHQGDIEGISVRVTPDFARVLAVRFEAHGVSRYFWPEQVTFRTDSVTGQATHPVVSAAMHSHATYNPTGYCPQDWVFQGEVAGVAGAIDLFGKDFNLDWCGGGYSGSDVKWRPWESPSSLKLVGLHQGEPINDQKWVKFQGRIGGQQTNEIKNWKGIHGDLDGDEQAYLTTLFLTTYIPEQVTRFFGALDNIYKSDGPLGLGSRDIIGTRASSSRAHYVRSKVRNTATNAKDLVLDHSPDVSGTRPYSVRPVQSCRASQVWDVTLWPGSTNSKAGTPAVALSNRYSGKLAVTGGDRQDLAPRAFSLATLRTDSLWLIDGLFLTPNLHPAFHMNVYGNDFAAAPGSGVGTWDGGACPMTGEMGFFCPNSAWSLEAAPCERPTSSIRIEGTRDSAGTYRGAVTITLTAQSHTEGATAGLRYKLDDAAHYEIYNGPLVLTEEGPRTISYYAVDTKGNTEASANSISITIRPTSAPGASTLSSPTGKVRALTPTFTFSRVPGASEYELWVKRGETMVFDTWYSWKAVCPGVNGVCSVTPAMALAAGTHTWWIRARNSVGLGPWSAGLGLEGIGPALVAPRGTIDTPTPTFLWNAVDGAAEYVLSIEHHNTDTRTEIVVPATVCSGGSCSTTPSKTLLVGYYRFWVRGGNAAGRGAWSAETEFSVSFDALAATLIGPTGKTNDPTPTYTWKEVPGAVEYQLWVTNVDGEQTVVKELHPSAVCASGVCSVTPTTTLAVGQHHFWVFTRFSTGPGLWSALMTFTRVP